MEKKSKDKYQEGVIKGKKVFFVGVLPVFIFFLFIGTVAFVISNFINTLSVNENDDVCNTVRRKYSNSIDSAWPCDTTDEGDYLLVIFDQSVNTGGASALMSFKYNKTTKAVEPALSIN